MTKTPVASVTPAPRLYYSELDGLRFLAFLLVFFNHQYALSEVPFFWLLQAKGWIGVNLFFALSAYLFTLLLRAEFAHTQRIRFKKFYIRRIFRIWPVYFVYVAFILLLYFGWHQGEASGMIKLRSLGLLTFTDNLMAAVYGGNPLPMTEHLWTIGFEEQFYIFIPFIIYFLVRSTRQVRVGTLITAFLVFSAIRLHFIVNDVPHPAVWVLPVTNYESILMGIVIGFGGLDFLVKRLKPELIFGLGLLFFVALYFQPRLNITSYWLFVGYSCVGLFTGLMLLAVTRSRILGRFFAQKWMVYLGKRSYGLYVYHFLGNAFALFIIHRIPALPSGLFFSFMYSLVFTIAAAILSYRVLEVPFLQWKKKFEIIPSRPV